MNEIRAARKRAEYLLEDPNVVGVGIGLKQVGGCVTDDLSVVASVVRKGPFYAKDIVPKVIGGWPTDVVQTGRFHALLERTDKWRPAPGGVSIGHFNITAGTFGCVAKLGDEWVILSNNHVLADMNNGRIGDEILQPGDHDGGVSPDDVIGTLEKFVPIEFLLDNLPDCPTATGLAKIANWFARRVGSKHRLRAYQEDPLAFNLVDAAIAKPKNQADVIRDVLGIQTPTGHRNVELGEVVVKSGRTTDVTRGPVTQVDATFQVMYGSNVAVFEQQIVCNVKCGGGDSGSIVLADGSSEVVGLLFAGSEDGETMIMNPIRYVLDLLGVTIATG